MECVQELFVVGGFVICPMRIKLASFACDCKHCEHLAWNTESCWCGKGVMGCNYDYEAEQEGSVWDM